MKRAIILILIFAMLLCAGCTRSASGDGQTTQAGESTQPSETTPQKPEVQGDPLALVVGEHEILTSELTYFYVDVIFQYCQQYGSYIGYLLDLEAPLSHQAAGEDGSSWADMFLASGVDNAKNTYALYDAAVAAGHQLSDREQEELDTLAEDMEKYAKESGFSSADEHLRSVYGERASLESYMAFCSVSALATSYYNAYSEQLKESYDDATLRGYEKDIEYQYDSYTFASTFVSADRFATRDELVAAVQLLSHKDNDTLEELNAAIARMEDELGVEEDKRSPATESKDVLYPKLGSVMSDWLRDRTRQEGDIVAIPYEETATGSDGKEVTTFKGYYVVLFQGRNDNFFPLANVRHILVAFEGGTKDALTGQTSYSDQEKQAAKTAAEALLKQWQEGEATEDSFAQLANKESDDGDGTTGGLYENVYPGQMVVNFNDWCFDESRVSGDTGIVESVYGYHVMYYSGDSELSYRDYLVMGDKFSEDMEKWTTQLFGSVEAQEKDLSGMDRDLAIKDLLS